MAILDDLLKNPEQIEQLLRMGSSNERIVSFNLNLISLYQFYKSPMLKRFIDLTALRTSLTRAENTSEIPFQNEFPEELFYGNIIVGHWALNPDIMVRFSIEELSGHIIVAGTTGSGKTNQLLYIIDQIIKLYED